jgi:hypothetical protein
MDIFQAVFLMSFVERFVLIPFFVKPVETEACTAGEQLARDKMGDRQNVYQWV